MVYVLGLRSSGLSREKKFKILGEAPGSYYLKRSKIRARRAPGPYKP